ncbi:hypothetical protein DFH08DRAFT_1034621 [Mycena albidolilacea]|uniref:F-box domain-containing protein n=1 Tax=Mycena albidolilacea TaxID=1033008 RepID=A0AAD6ZFJ2_9AGAR|nr:hypothetical protein DFH08DRAFT_1034621 [Mycena albidolilacea]
MLNALAADRARIADLDAQIRDLERSLSVLRSENSAAQERLDSYKYPVLTLPNEIVCEIFVHFLPPYPICPPSTGPLSPILLTHICRGWREIAMASPALWRAIHISGNDDLVSTFLSRSVLRPLSIHLNEWQQPFDDLAQDFLAPLLPHCARLEYLTLRLSTYFGPPLIDAVMPLLQRIDLALDNYSESPLVVLRPVPLLRAAVLNDCAAASTALPWAQLTSLTLTMMWPHECIRFCRKHPVYDGVEVTLPSLESLTLTDPPGVNEHPMLSTHLRTFITPALCKLQIQEHFLGSDPIQSLTSFISKSGCNLAHVHIANRRSVPETSYRTAFPSIPTLLFSRAGWRDSTSSDDESDSNPYE